MDERRRKAIELLLNGMTVTEAAKQIGMEPREVGIWTREPEFAAVLSRHRRENRQALSHALDIGAREAVDVLRGLITDEKSDADTRLKASATLLKFSKQSPPGIDIVRDVPTKGAEVLPFPTIAKGPDAHPGLSQVVHREVRFADLAYIGDRSLQILVKQISREDLIHSLMGMDPAMRALFLSNVSRRKSDDLVEEIDALGELNPETMETAQARVIETAIQLAEAGHIYMPPARG